MDLKPHPIPNAYWVAPHNLLAGPYPSAKDQAAAVAKLELLLAAGVTAFLDLTQANEYDLRQYAELLPAMAKASGKPLLHRRMEIPDMGVSSIAQMRAALTQIETWIGQGETVYVHCYGGIGRTGTLVGCYLIEQGADPSTVIATIAQHRATTPKGQRDSPETATQRQFMLDWQGKNR